MYHKIKDIISDAFGLVIWCIVAVMLLRGQMQFIWEGVVGIAVGAIFFMIPDGGIVSIIKGFLSAFNKKVDKE